MPTPNKRMASTRMANTWTANTWMANVQTANANQILPKNQHFCIDFEMPTHCGQPDWERSEDSRWWIPTPCWRPLWPWCFEEVSLQGLYCYISPRYHHHPAHLIFFTLKGGLSLRTELGVGRTNSPLNSRQSAFLLTTKQLLFALCSFPSCT